jgi:TM2 domain-containing membrane protein YozV
VSVTDRDLIEIESLVEGKAKNRLAAYAFWFFLGWLGAHRFYAGRTKSAFCMLALTLTGIGLPISIFWWMADAIVLNSILEEERELLFDQQARLFLEDRQF